MKLLIVEDELALNEAISNYLSEQGFLCESAGTCSVAEEKILLYEYDAVILDITLPDGNGLKLLELVRQQDPKPGVIILSARNSLDDRLKGLDLGADDYLAKPFHLSELNARIHAILRRNQFEGQPVISMHELQLNPRAKTVQVHADDVDLTRKEYELLLYLMSNRNRVLTREAIAEHLWGESSDFMDSHDFIYTHIKNLRSKLKAAGAGDYLKTIYGLGYRFGEK